MKILLTGGLHEGKSTIVKKVIEGINSEKVYGFFTSPLFEGGEKTGHKLILTNGESFIFAHKNIKSEIVFGEFGVDISVFEKAAEYLKQIRSEDWLVVDELGIMETLGGNFGGTIGGIIKEQKKTIIVVQSRILEFWLEHLSVHSFDVIIKVAKENRDKIPGWLNNIIHQNNYS